MPEGRADEGWAAFGFIYEDPDDLPDGLGQPPAGRHVAAQPHGDRPDLPELRRLPCRRVRTATDARAGGRRRHAVEHRRPVGVPGLPGARRRWTSASRADRFLAEIDHLGLELDLVNRLALKLVGVGIVRERLLAIVDRFDDFVRARADLRPGPLRHLQPGQGAAELGLRRRSPERERIGVVDFPSVWMQGPKEGMQLHWDGNNTKVSRAQPLRRLRHRRDAADPRPRVARRASRTGWRPPSRRASPTSSPAPVRPGLAAAGRAGLRPRMRRLPRRQRPRLRRREVGQGHADRARSAPTAARLDNYTRALAVNQNVLYAEFGAERFQTFRKTDGYANAPLDGLLAAGAVPAQRLGADARGAARPARGAAARVPARARRLRPACDGLRERPGAASIRRCTGGSSAT